MPAYIPSSQLSPAELAIRREKDRLRSAKSYANPEVKERKLAKAKKPSVPIEITLPAHVDAMTNEMHNVVLINKIPEKAKIVEKDDSPKEYTYDALKDWIDAKFDENPNDNKIRSYRSALKTIREISPFEDFRVLFQTHEQTIKDFEYAKKKDGDSYANNSKKQYVQAMLYFETNYPVPISAEDKKAITTYFEVLKVKSEIKTILNKSAEIMPFAEYKKLIEVKFGKDSKEYLLVRLYQECIARDDFALEITNDVPTDESKNYIVVKKSSGQVILNKYKTAKKYGKKVYNLSKPLMTLIRAYIKRNSLGNGQYIFGNKSLSPFVTNMNREVGVKTGFNYLRHALISEFDKTNPTPEQRVEFADICGHSAGTQANYVRELAETD